MYVATMCITQKYIIQMYARLHTLQHNRLMRAFLRVSTAGKQAAPKADWAPRLWSKRRANGFW